MAPPIKTTIDDIDALFAYLKTQIGWVPLEKVRKTIDSKYADNRKVEACRYLGLIERDGSNIKLSESGREYAAGDAEAKVQVMRTAIKAVPLYFRLSNGFITASAPSQLVRRLGTIGTITRSSCSTAPKCSAHRCCDLLFRVAGAAGLGKFISAGNNRPTALLRADLEAIEALVIAPTDVLPAAHNAETIKPASATIAATSAEPAAPPATQVSEKATPLVQTSPAVHVTIEIHIAADATTQTVEDIFKNMRKYVLSDGD